MSLGWIWALIAGFLFGVFVTGAVLTCSKKLRKTGGRLMALSALCAWIVALMFAFSPDNPNIAKPLSDKVYELVNSVLGG